MACQAEEGQNSKHQHKMCMNISRRMAKHEAPAQGEYDSVDENTCEGNDEDDDANDKTRERNNRSSSIRRIRRKSWTIIITLVGLEEAEAR